MKKYIVLIACLLTGTACNKALNTTPTDFVSPDSYYTTAAHLQAGLNAVYNGLQNSATYGGPTYITNMCWSTDEGQPRVFGTNQLNTYSYNSADPTVTAFWAECYTAIVRANELLAGINTPVMDETQRGIIKGQALFLRGYFYFLLVHNFGDVPLVLLPNHSVSETAIARTPTAQVYASIIADMTAAETLLQTQTASAVGNGAVVCVTTVEGILARVCLYAAGYPNNDHSKYADALKWANKVIASGQHSLNPDFTRIFKNYSQDIYDVKESMWEVDFYLNGLITTNAGWVGVYSGPQANLASLVPAPAPGFCYGTQMASGKLYNLFPVDAASTAASIKASLDLRRDWDIANYNLNSSTTTAIVHSAVITTSWAMYQAKFYREYESTPLAFKQKNQTNMNWPLLRYSDVLLMAAEAENEVNAGATTNAINELNQVRKRGMGILYGNVLKEITITNGGTGYTTAPTVTIAGGGGSGATATAIITSGKVTGINILTRTDFTSSSSYYTTPPTVTFTGGGGTGAVATATISTNADANYTGATDHDSFLAALQDERSRELCYEGLRKADLIRWNIFVPTLKSFLALTNTNTTGKAFNQALINVDQHHVLQPIPIRDIVLNPLLTQNPGW